MRIVVSTVYCEGKKMFSCRIIKLTLIVHCIFVLLMSSVCIYNASSPYYICLRGLLNTLNFLEGTLIVSLYSYSMGMEYELNTIKILKTKNIKSWKIITSKTIIGVILISIYILLAFIITLLVGKYAVSSSNDIQTNFRTCNFIIKHSEALKFMIKLYTAQGVAFIYILSIAIFFNILIKKAVPSTFVTLSFIYTSSILGNALDKINMSQLKLYIPINAEYIWREYETDTVIPRLMCLLVYSLIIGILNIYLYRRQSIL